MSSRPAALRVALVIVTCFAPEPYRRSVEELKTEVQSQTRRTEAVGRCGLAPPPAVSGIPAPTPIATGPTAPGDRRALQKMNG